MHAAAIVWTPFISALSELLQSHLLYHFLTQKDQITAEDPTLKRTELAKKVGLCPSWSLVLHKTGLKRQQGTFVTYSSHIYGGFLCSLML